VFGFVDEKGEWEAEATDFFLFFLVFWGNGPG
jgi:hypothetical protein